ncbi:hypothetical protein LCGC14_0896180 [marine sediment metagenome]|uniref:NodB homology domain-containing protein n=1 Tax=marine sediment metagenome TaxID=412755 RepID=A0A0F9NXZ0_9ZZZZ
MSSLFLVAIMATTPNPVITIDDGPDHRYHVRTLQLLRRHKTKAIWFVNGHFLRNKRNRVLLRQISRTGTLGNHTFTHQQPCRMSASRFRWELRRNERAVNRTLGWPARHRMKLYRPPFGQRCHVKLARRLSYRVVFWHTADLGSTAAKMIRVVLRRHRRYRGRRTILLFHHHNRKLQVALRRFFPRRLKRSPSRH